MLYVLVTQIRFSFLICFYFILAKSNLLFTTAFSLTQNLLKGFKFRKHLKIFFKLCMKGYNTEKAEGRAG